MPIGDTTAGPLPPAAPPASVPRPDHTLAAGAPPRMAADGLRLRDVGPGGSPGAPLGWVRAQGSRLVDAQGRDVPIRGVNLGGWLVQEPWMMPLVADPGDGPPFKDEAAVWGELARRFGAAEMQRLREAYRTAWLADDDFVRIKAAGFNTVRLPFTAANLAEPDGYKWLDGALDRAAKHGLYVVLDLHGAPGGQSKEMHTGKAGENRFFQDPALVKQAAGLWQEVARRYADRPEVLGYDVLNEPMGAESAQQLYDVQNTLYQAIRAVDPRHVVMLEDGYKGLDTFPRPSRYGWENVAYSVHQYQFKAKQPGDHLAAMRGAIADVERVREARDVPVFIGEFNVPGAEADTLATLVGALRDAAVPWSVWTYKAVMPRAAEHNVWGLYHNQREAAPLDVRHDSLAELYRKIGLMRTEHLQAMPGAERIFQDDGQRHPARRREGLARAWLLAVDRVRTGVAALVDAFKRWW